MDGGYRGMVQIIPKLPTGAAHQKHLKMLRVAFEQAAKFRDWTLGAKSDAGTAPRIPYRFFPTEVRFFETRPKKTPSAYAIDTRIAYNIIGTLMQTEESVALTMIHEVFHLNDQAHKDWSITALSGIHAQLIQKCGTRMDCLAPYAPGTTTVKGGTYYAFQPGNDAREYAAELMTRIYTEGMHKPKRMFKCANAINAKAHAEMVQEFFGTDPLPPCP
jgi:hypothetical protein